MVYIFDKANADARPMSSNGTKRKSSDEAENESVS
jgi:hypothetical protein